MSDLWVVIPAAGESRRFKEAGYQTLKPLLTLKSPEGYISTMLGHVIKSLPAYPHHLIIALPFGAKFIYDDVAKIEIARTRGQADSLFQVVQGVPSNDQVLVLDCDMLLKPKDLMLLVGLLQIYDISVAVTETFDPNASRVDEVPIPTRFVEKQPISQWGIVGARGFRNAGILTEALRKTLEETKEEPYLSMAMNNYPGTKIAHVITEYIDFGTPERIKEAGWEIL